MFPIHMFNTYKHINNLYAYAISLNLLKYHDEQPLFDTCAQKLQKVGYPCRELDIKTYWWNSLHIMRNAYVSRVVLRIYVSVWSFRLVFFAISQKCFVSWSLGLFKCVCKGRDLSCRIFFTREVNHIASIWCTQPWFDILDPVFLASVQTFRTWAHCLLKQQQLTRIYMRIF